MSRKVIMSLTGSTYSYDDYTTKLLEEKDIHLLFTERYQWVDTEYRIDKHVVLYNDNYYKLNDIIPKNSDNLESIYDLEDDDLIINLNERGLKLDSIQSLAQHSKNHLVFGIRIPLTSIKEKNDVLIILIFDSEHTL